MGFVVLKLMLFMLRKELRFNEERGFLEFGRFRFFFGWILVCRDFVEFLGILFCLGRFACRRVVIFVLELDDVMRLNRLVKGSG